ncbi:MAG: helix-turn-helix transcriptional regulator [Candidatus Binatus sp.]|uniref:helix-turn-helix domain-containing protein n=1 Tax=Candidatus Binatus sp. TaxID=2811406 RepID=UPI003D0E21F5
MPTFQTSILHEIAHGKPISLRTRLLYRRRLQNRVQRLLRKAFRDEQKRTGLTQKEFAERIDKDKSKVNQWLSIASNLTLETISDLLLGLGVDLDELSVTRLANLIMQTANDIEEEEKASPPPPQLPQLNPPPAAQSASALESQQNWNPPLLGLGDDPAHQVTP